MTDKSVVEALKEARRLCAEGWTKGKLHDDGRYCIMGAVQKATSSNYLEDSCRSILKDRVGLMPWQSIATWNDSAGRTQAEVLALFDKAIASAEAV